MDARSVYITIEASNPTVGLWCDDCNLPSVVRYPIVTMSLDGVGPAGFWIACMNCEEWKGDDEY